MNTLPLEVDTRTLINKNLENLGWNLDGVNKNVFQEQPRTEEERKKLGGKRPDYVLYSKEVDSKPLIIIEAKKKGERIDNALEQGIHYAKELNAPIVFATDGLFCKSYHTKFEKTPILNGEEVDEFLREALALKYLNTWEVNTVSPKVQYDRKELIKIFDEANNMLRGDGLRAGIERFGEFANILFLKLISESEDNKKLAGIESKFDTMCHWDYIKDLKPNSRIEHINKIVYEKLNNLYKTDIFTPLSIRDTSILNEIMKKLEPLTLTDVDSDIKGDAFEYFLKESTATKNDLGEYFTPRHIVKTMVKLVNPQIGEKIYDPFCGTGGFLIESFRHIWNTMPRNDTTINMLHSDTIYGNEITNTARITKMNMILAGDGHNGIEMKDSLASPVEGKYDIVLANMPYSQKTRYGNLYDLPSTNGDSICVQHCIKAISSTSANGRMALVVPEGFLFRKDLAKTRELLLNNCELQSVISLPQGVFLPYTGVKTNIVYATKINQKISSKDKKDNFWYFEVKSDGYTLDSHRRKLENTKNDLDIYQEYRKFDNNQKQEMLDVGFDLIPISKVEKNDYNLLGSRYREVNLKTSTTDMLELSTLFPIIKNGFNVNQIDNKAKYRVSRIETISNGTFNELKTKWTDDNVTEEKFLQSGDILLSHINSYEHLAKSAIYLQSEEKVVHGTNLIRLVANKEVINPKYAIYVLKSSYFIEQAKRFAQRAVNQASIRVSDLKTIKIPVPSLEEQQHIINELDSYQKIIDGAKLIVDNYKLTIKIQDTWKKEKLGNIAEVIAGQSPKGEYYNEIRNGTPFYQGKSEFTYKYLGSPKKWTTKTTKIALKDDIVMSVRAPVGPVNIATQEICIGRGLSAIRTNSKKVRNEYLFIYLKMNETNIKGNSGAVFDCINKESICNLEIPLPTIEEQEYIINKINEEYAQIESAKKTVQIFELKIQDRINELFN